MIKIIINNRKY